MSALACAAVLALYIAAVRRYRTRFPERAFPVYRAAAFVCGLAAMTAAFAPPVDALADRSFAWHMTQHLLLAFVAPPLLLLGAPLLLLVATTPAALARAFTRFSHAFAGQVLFAPLTGWLGMVFILWGVHFSPLFEIALQTPWVHVVEHALFFGGGILFWAAVVQVGYAPRPLAYPARMLYLFLALPQGAFVAFALAASNHVLYAHYALALGGAALADQRDGADVMWIAGGFLLFCAFMAQGAAWAASERRTCSA